MMATDIENTGQMHTEEQYKAVQEIHDLLADSRKNYKAAAHRSGDEHVKQLLLRISEERNVLERELAQDLLEHGPRDPIGDGTLGGTVQRVLLTFRDLINSTSEVNVLVECERQEGDLLGRYTHVLNSVDLNEGTRALLTRQYAELERNMHAITQTRESLEAVEH